jgi:glutathione S-transferase
MILIGQYDSPFVRRVGIALTLYDMAFEHRPWSVFSDVEKVRAFNPLCRVPVLVLDTGESLVESHAMLDHLDSLAPIERRMFPASDPARHHALKVASLATGLADKAVALFYEQRLHRIVSEDWVSRCCMQITGALGALEKDRARRKSAFWFGARIGHADIVVATVLRHFREAHPGLVSFNSYPALAAHAAKLEAMDVFKTISQPFVPPA